MIFPGLLFLVYHSSIIDTEEHFLTECHGYHELRLGLLENLKSLIILKGRNSLLSNHHVAELGKHLTDSNRLRNPPKALKRGPTPRLPMTVVQNEA